MLNLRRGSISFRFGKLFTPETRNEKRATHIREHESVAKIRPDRRFWLSKYQEQVGIGFARGTRSLRVG